MGIMNPHRSDETFESAKRFESSSSPTEVNGRLENHGVIRNARLHPVPNQRLFSVGTAARYLGISDDTLRKYADLGKIPVYRFINGNRVFKLEDLDALIDALPLWKDQNNDATCAGRDKEAS